MGKKANKCVICGALIEFDEASGQYRCSKCKANYEENLLTPAKNAPKPKREKMRIRWCLVFLSMIYVLWLIYWFLR